MKSNLATTVFKPKDDESKVQFAERLKSAYQIEFADWLAQQAPDVKRAYPKKKIWDELPEIGSPSEILTKNQDEGGHMSESTNKEAGSTDETADFGLELDDMREAAINKLAKVRPDMSFNEWLRKHGKAAYAKNPGYALWPTLRATEMMLVK